MAHLEVGVKLAVTGSAGVFGQAIVPRLRAAGHDIVPIDLAGHDHDDRSTFRADVRDENALRQAFDGCEQVVHAAAALPSYPAEQIASVDVGGTRAVLAAAAAAGCARVVHLSSTAVYGLPDVVPTPEDHPRSGVDPYSRAKIAAEVECERARDRGQVVSILRPKTFLGPGRLGIFAMLFQWAQEGRDFPVLGDGSQLTQLLDVDDLCDAAITVLDAPAGTLNDTWNLGATQFRGIGTDFQAVLDAAGHGGRIRHLPIAPAVAALRVAAAVKASPVYPRLIFKLRGHSYVSVDKAQRDLGFAPRHSNASTLLRTFDWWRSSATARTAETGSAHTAPWRQGVLRLVKPAF